MTRSYPATTLSSVDVYDQQDSIPRYQCARPASFLASTRMIDYPTPPRTQSRATSISGSSAPTTPSQGLGLLNCPFSSSLVDAFSTCSSSSTLPAAADGDWSIPVTMCGNTHEDNSRLDLFRIAPSTLSSTTLDTTAFYTPSAISSTSMPTQCTDIDFVLLQQQAPVMPQGHFHHPDCSCLKQEGDDESWFNDHIDLERSQSRMESSSSRQKKSSSLSPTDVTNSRLMSSPGVTFGALSPYSSEQSQQRETASISRGGSVESCTAFHPMASDRTSTKGRRYSANSERRYFCSVCNRACDKKYNLREHEKIHDPTRVSQFLCPRPGCGKRLGRKTDVKRHIQSVHEKEKKFACDKCFKRFDRKDTLSR
jgi:hypothetical protein